MNTISHEEALPCGLSPTPRRSRFRLTLLTLITFGLGLGVGMSLARVVPAWMEYRRVENFVGCVSNLGRIGGALDAYARDHKGQFPASQYELVPAYLSALPTCPEAGRVTYRTSFAVDRGDDMSYLVECCGSNHRRAHLAPNFPAIGSVYGLQTRWMW